MNYYEISSYISGKYLIDEEKANNISEAFINFDAQPKGRDLSDVEAKFMACNQNGFDGATFRAYLERKFGIKKDLAVRLAISIQSKFEFQKRSSEMIKSGFSDGEWQFLSSCSGPHREKHRLLNGIKFPLNKGLFTDGEFLNPGYDWDCGCAFRPVILLTKAEPEKKLGALEKIIRFFSKKGA